MNNNYSRCGLKFPTVIGLTIAMLVAAVCGPCLRAVPTDELLEKAIYVEETKGELPAARELYEQILKDPTTDRSLVAQAQLRLGLCELKLGEKSRAVSALEQLSRNFPDKENLLELVEHHMPALLDEMLTQIGENYIAEVDRAELMEAAIRAIVGKLDSSSTFLRTNDMAFLSAAEMNSLEEGIAQKIGGIGAMLKFDEAAREVVIVTPLPNSPALKGGLRAGDRVIAVDEVVFPSGREVETARKLLRGSIGTTVTAKIKRDGELIDIRLVRDSVSLPSIRGDHYKSDNSPEFMVDAEKKIGYVRLTTLGKESAKEMKTALQQLKAQGMKVLVLDLRNNPGGLLESAIQVSDLFVDSGTIVTIRGRTGDQVYEAKEEGSLGAFPVALLINRNTASAAEIIAACLQDNKRARVIGERTYGQALVKSLISMKSGIGTLKLPVAAYFRPNGKNMNRYPGMMDTEDWGVKPDEGFEVALSDQELKEFEKSLNEREILGPNAGAKSEFLDRQLQKALQYLSESTH
jgi:carboxyl-terminal processing protease